MVHLAIGGMAAVLGASAAGVGLFGDNAQVAGLLGLAAGALGGVQTLLRPERMTYHHWTRYARIGRLADDTAPSSMTPLTHRETSSTSLRFGKSRRIFLRTPSDAQLSLRARGNARDHTCSRTITCRLTLRR